ncbi:MAG TPA: DUF4388 domain-containing protein [Vicinamibacteria bacterium]|nr:DUF4388 domain-containing protein [Vicinamibacteria bacterium]
MAFQGSLAELHLPDIIQLISVSGKTGVFHLTDGALKGRIYLNDGKIVHAELEDTSGEEAVYALAIWSQGDFRFEPGIATDQRTITKSNTNLLMEAARRLDEWRVLSKKVPSVDMIPEFVVQDAREGQINLNTSEWLILSKIDGARSVKTIAQSAGLSVFDVAKILYGLVATSLIRLKTAPEGAVRPAAKAGAVVSPGGPLAPPTPVSPRAANTAAVRETELLLRLNRVREVCNALLGAVGESVVNKHYQKARTELERGAGMEAIEEAINQIARAASILKGPSTTESLLEQLRALK